MSFFSPCNTGRKIVERGWIETLFIAARDVFLRLLPVRPGRGEGIWAQSASEATCPSDLFRMVRVVQSVRHYVEKTGSVTLNAPFVGGISLSEIPMALYVAGILLLVFAAQLVL